jgi:hypothetical protein
MMMFMCAFTAASEQFHHSLSKGFFGNQIRGHEFVLEKLADRHERAVQSKWRNDGIDAGAVRQSSVHHRIGLVDPASHLRNDLVDDPQQMLIITKSYVSQLQQTSALDVDLFAAVDEDIGDGRIHKQRLKRSQTKDLVEYFVANLLFFDRTEQRGLTVDQRNQGLPNFAPNPLVVDHRQGFEVDLVKELAMQGEF